MLWIKKIDYSICSIWLENKEQLQALGRMYRILERSCVNLALYARVCGTFKESSTPEPEAKHLKLSIEHVPEAVVDVIDLTDS